MNNCTLTSEKLKALNKLKGTKLKWQCGNDPKNGNDQKHGNDQKRKIFLTGKVTGIAINVQYVFHLFRSQHVPGQSYSEQQRLPFDVELIIWGLLYPLLKPAWSRRYALILLVWLVAFLAFLFDPSWYLNNAKNPVFVVAVLACVGFSVLAARFLRARYSQAFIVGNAALALGLVFVFMAAVGGQLIARPLTITFTPDPYIHQWGRSAEEIVPVGEQIVAPPMSSWVKLATERGVIADCKDVPYGGAAWKEWKERLGDLGGVEQCVGAHPPQFGALSGEQLETLAKKYDSRFIMLDGTTPDQEAQLKELGWKVVVRPVGDVTATLMKRS